MGEALADFREKIPGEVLSPVIEPVDVAFVKAKHGSRMSFGQIVALHGSDVNPPLQNLPALSFDFVPAIAPETPEIIVEALKFVILPMKLQPVPLHESKLLER